MTKNLMPEILKMLGVEYGEKFKLCHFESKVFQNGLFYFDNMEGLVQVTDGDVIDNVCDKLYDILIGYFEIVKLPWEPKEGEIYYYPAVYTREIHSVKWCGITADYTLKALGMVYRTQEEAQAHFAEDYERLTGKPLSSR